jgi:hypothetical protein
MLFFGAMGRERCQIQSALWWTPSLLGDFFWLVVAVDVAVDGYIPRQVDKLPREYYLTAYLPYAMRLAESWW